ncbi:MAG TPA: HAD-IIB family hydrolase [Candidatus Nitrosotenuis sp.]|nr:HAD-IIB family hydrolase [Candidatus Nitrosotenuis sp.]
MLPSHLILFTDLDSTLLDHHTYSWRAAEDALAELRRRKVPLVFCTSKTRAEVEFLRRKMNNEHPFITENGGGVFIPHGYFRHRIEAAKTVKTYHCIALARPYEEISAALDDLARDAGVEVVGFHHLRPKEVAENCGLPVPQAELAKLRDFDEPFFFAGSTPVAEARFEALARERRFDLTRGSRFWHLHAGSDKGRAVRELMNHFRQSRRGERLRSIGLGDALNDLPMLTAVDKAILVQRHDGSYDQSVVEKIPRITLAGAPGPEGWNRAVLELLES